MQLSMFTLMVFGIATVAHASNFGHVQGGNLQMIKDRGETTESNKTIEATSKTTIKGTIKGTGEMSIKGTGRMTIKGTGDQTHTTLKASSKAKANANATTIHPEIVTISASITSVQIQSAKGVAPASTTKSSINSATLTTPAILATGSASPNATTTSRANVTTPEAETAASTSAKATFKGAAHQAGTSMSGALVGFLVMLLL